MKLSLSPVVKPSEPHQFLASSSTGIENDAEEVVERGEKAATHLTNHPNSFKHKFRTKISHKSDTKRTTVTVLPPRFKSQLAFGQTTTISWTLKIPPNENKFWWNIKIETRG